MTEWKSYPLGELCSLRAGVAFKTADQGSPSGEFPFIKVSDMNLSQNSIAIRDANNWVDSDYIKRTKAKIFPVGTVVFAKIGEALKHNRVRQIVRPTLIDNNMMGARPNPEVVQRKFLYYMLSSFDIASTATGTALPYLTVSVLERQRFLVPPLGIQRRIASILSAYDDLIENNTRRIAILEEMARRIYEEWFVRFRFPGYEQVKMVESELGLIPEGWQVTNLDAVSEYINRGLTPKYDELADGIVINQKCIRGQKLSYELVRRQSKPIPADKRVRYGDVLVNSTGVGTLGRVAQVLDERPDCTVDTHVTIVRPGKQVTTHFYGLSLLAREEYFEQQGVGATGQTELGRGRVAETTFILPPLVVQEQFDELVAPMRQMTVTLTSKNANLRATRDLLLPKLISGELDVSKLPEPTV